ncbi:MAG: dihydrofolate reductase [Verrucomicrobiales bacterium]|nr:dihydrofolate reductase [Verrucomicrobiales bacterium]
MQETDRPTAITLIAAVADDGFLSGENGGIPWHLPRDIRHFRRHAAGKFLLLGRTTFEEMRGWFTDQIPLVLTRNPAVLSPPGIPVETVADAVAIVRAAAALPLLVCGGAQTYAAALPSADTLILTRVHTILGRGKSFPSLPPEWQETAREHFPADAENPLPMTILHLKHPSSPHPFPSLPT